MLFVRADNVVNLFEMKYTSDVYTVTAKYAEELATKISAFQTATATKRAIHPVLMQAYFRMVLFSFQQ